MNELKPCPFCGEDAYVIKNGRWHWLVGCFNNLVCDVTPKVNHFKKDLAIEAWNNRPSPWQTGIPTDSGNYLVFYLDDHNPMGMFIPHLFNGILGFNAETSEWIDEDGLVAFCNEEICLWQKIDMPSDKFLASLRC